MKRRDFSNIQKHQFLDNSNLFGDNKLKLIKYFSKRFLPRWLVLIFDLLILPFTYFLAYLLRFNFDLSDVYANTEARHFIFIFPVFMFCYYQSKTYSGILRQSTSGDIIRIIFSISCAGILLILFSFSGRLLNAPDFLILPYSVIVIMVLATLTFLILSRLIAKTIFAELLSDNTPVRNLIIFGAGQLGHITRNSLMQDTSSNVRVIGFIDDNPSLQNKTFSGTPIYSETKAFNAIIPAKKVTELIIAVDSSKITWLRKREISDKCLEKRIDIKEVPPLKSWINGEFRAENIKNIKIEDLLGRDAIQMERKTIQKRFVDSVVLVTGAAGSIGSEIVRQLLSFHVKQVILLDKAESDLFNLQHEIITKK